ncbi:MAG: hypothetical protein LBO02_03500 [Holosporaceae bacterium]|nr:hypothetical protein [Holosporaceae bacterium]
MKLFRNRSRGALILEVTLTLPIVCFLIFFILETMKLNDVKTSVDIISMDIAFDFMSSKETAKFSKIIEKHKPPFVKNSDITWYFAVYKDLQTLNSETALYGDEEVYWPKDPTGLAAEDYIDMNADGSFKSRNSKVALALTNYQKPELNFKPIKTDASEGLGGKAFVLTIVCDYKFSSVFVEKLYMGGKNTRGKKKFLLWGKCLGVCN